MNQRHFAALLLALVAGSLAGCANMPQGQMAEPGQRPYVQPMAAPYQLPTYQMPIQRSTTCTTQRFGNQLQTYCQ